MSNTPRTDAHAFTEETNTAWPEHRQAVVHADFARTLERELVRGGAIQKAFGYSRRKLDFRA